MERKGYRQAAEVLASTGNAADFLMGIAQKKSISHEEIQWANALYKIAQDDPNTLKNPKFDACAVKFLCDAIIYRTQSEDQSISARARGVLNTKADFYVQGAQVFMDEMKNPNPNFLLAQVRAQRIDLLHSKRKAKQIR